MRRFASFFLIVAKGSTIYFGFPLVSMHTLFELIHKGDLYSAYLAYRFFLEDELKKKLSGISSLCSARVRFFRRVRFYSMR